jgi:hypothetical protein
VGTKAGQLLWQIPLTVLACISGSVVIAWAVSRVMGFTMNASVVVLLSAVLSAAAIAVELRGNRKNAKSAA